MKNFESLKPTTMTLVAKLNGNVNRKNAVALIEVHHMSKESSGKTIPHPGKSGLITVVNYSECRRGIIRDKNSFRNSIMMMISTKNKNINIKLSENTIQMCGVPNYRVAEEAIQGLMRNIKYTQGMIIRMKNNDEMSRKCCEWVKKCTVGETDEETKKTKVIIPEDISSKVPEDLDKNICFFMLRKAADFSDHNTYVSQLDWMLTYPMIYKDNVEPSVIMSSMVNYNFYIGFAVDRWTLCREIRNLNIKGVKTRFLNTVDNSARITIEYEIPEYLKDYIRKREEKKRFTILVHKTGQATLTGPHPDMNKSAYCYFMKILSMVERSVKID